MKIAGNLVTVKQNVTIAGLSFAIVARLGFFRFVRDAKKKGSATKKNNFYK